MGRRGGMGRNGGMGGTGRKCVGSGMHLQGGLRCEHDARTAAEVNRLVQRVAGEDAGAGTDQDDVGGTVEIEGAADAKRWLGVGVGHNGPAAPCLEHKLEARRSADRRGGSGIGKGVIKSPIHKADRA
jgi:hypothetical protein